MYVFEFYFVYKMLRVFTTKVNIHIDSCYILRCRLDMSYRYYLGPEIGTYRYVWQ